MFVLFNSLFNKILVSILFFGVAASAAAHTYFFGVSDLTINKTSKHIEVIHQFTAHDIENTIAELRQVSLSPEHPKYDDFIQEYIEKHFVLQRDNIPIKMNWIGFEIKRGQLFAYQESVTENFLTNLVVKNTILIDTYAKQVNTVNYQYFSSTRKVQGSLSFDHSLKVAKITSNK